VTKKAYKPYVDALLVLCPTHMPNPNM